MTITPILQFGTSRFLQAHADLFVSEAMETGAALGPITIIKTSRDASRDGRLKGLASPAGFPVEIKGLKDGKVIDRTVTVRSVARALSAASDWTEITRIAVDEVELIISNTAEGGYALDPTETAPPSGVSASFPGKLVQLLRTRFETNGRPLSIIPTELVTRNGDVLSGIVRALAEDWYGDPAFTAFLERDVTFASSLVDRIVSRALEPAGAVAEPYALWAIEAKPGLTLPCVHPSIVTAPDISRFEQLKLFILNLGHTCLVDHWLTHGAAERLTVREILADPDARAALETLYRDEILPGFAACGMRDEAVAYVAATLERFANPFLDHRLADIHQHHAEKIRRRAGGFLAWAGAEGKPRLSALLQSAG